jgi:hypothetical protein
LAYGWLDELLDQPLASNRYVTAFVLSKLEHEGCSLGYEGLVQDITTDSDRQIVSVVISDCARFIVRLSETEVARTTIVSPRGIPLMYFGRDDIANIAFSIFEIQDTEQDADPELPLASPAPE